MKLCTLCKSIKPEDEFNFKYKSRGIRQKHCRECSKLEIKRHYIENRQYYLDKAKKRNVIIHRKLNDYVLEYLSNHPCVDCGEGDPIVLEFDHLGNKYKQIAKLKRDSSIERLKVEILKCEVRCANCHRRKTVERIDDKIRLEHL